MSDLIRRDDAIAALWDMTTEDCPNPGAAVGKCMEVLRHLPTADRQQEICEFGEYCMCATCFYQNDCSNCADCMSNNNQIHDIWSCTKYMRKEHLRKGTGDAQQ